MGNRFAIHHDENAEVYQTLATGNRLLRLGYRERAEMLFTEIDGRGDGNTRFRSRMGLIICRRLMGDFEQVRILIDDGLKSLNDLTPAWRRDMAWERIICQATEEKDTTPMILATQRGGSHFGATYIVEAAVFTMAQKKKSMLERIRPIHAIRRDKSLRPRERWPLMTVAEIIQKAYDTSIPIDIRVQDVGKALLLAKRVPSVDGEMVVWVAAARWFYRMHIEEPLSICLGSYENLSMMVSSYTNKDSMGLADDMDR